MKGKQVYIPIVRYNMKGEVGHSILGVFSDLEDAKEAMLRDIDAIKSDWRIDDDWEVEYDSETCYEAHDAEYDYQYDVNIETKTIQ